MNRPAPAETKLLICVWHPFTQWRPQPLMPESIRRRWPEMRVVHLPDYDDLPREAQRYVAFLEEVSGVPVSIVSTGSGRGDTIIREKSAAAEWFGVGTAS